MPQFKMPISNIADWNDLTEFQQGYWEAAFFTSTGPDYADQNMEDVETGEIALTALKDAAKDCDAFLFKVKKAGLSFGNATDTQAGHDFWFTRNGHGVGFWDKPEYYGDDKDALTELCQYDETYIYRGDDGFIYHD